ncbi:MAG: hypothetical protein ACOC84_07775, partial [Actinomycetota bacterium]
MWQALDIALGKIVGKRCERILDHVPVVEQPLLAARSETPAREKALEASVKRLESTPVVGEPLPKSSGRPRTHP